MGDFDKSILRGDVPIPETIATEVIQEAVKQGIVLNRARKVPMSTKTYKQPVLSTLPEAYWVNGDTGLKKTTKMSYRIPVMTAEELAAIAVIPDAVFDDTNIDLWAALKPLIAESIALKIDQAAIFGVDKPASWPTALVPGAVAAGNVVAAGGSTAVAGDLGVDVAKLGIKIASNSGYKMRGFVAPLGFEWQMLALRDADGKPLYDSASQALYGRYPVDEMEAGGWADTTPDTLMVGVDWDKCFVGVRQDITIKMLDQAVLSDADGNIIINLAQQDAKAMRIVFRPGFQIFNPATRLTEDTAKLYPAGVIRAAA